MREKAGTFWEKQGARLLFLVGVLLALGAVWYVGARVPLENTRLTHTVPSRFSQGWFAETRTGVVAVPEAFRPAGEDAARPARLVNTLPADMAANTSLCFQTKNESVRVYVDGQLVYTYGETPQLTFGHGVGAVWNMVPLPEDAAGKEITVELTPVDKRTGLAPYEFLLGGYNSIITFLIKEKAPLATVCMLLAFIGLGSLALFFVGLARRSAWANSMLYLSMFVLLSAIWTAADSGLFQFLMPNKGVAYLLFGSSFYLLCTPFALFMAEVEPRYGRMYRIFATVNAVYAILRILLYIAGAMNFESGLWVVHVIMGALICAINLTLWIPAFKTQEIPRPELYLAVTVLSLVAGASLISFYTGDKLDVQRNGYASGFYWGILLFVLITIIGTVREGQQIRQQAFRAAFYERRAYTDELTELMNVKGFDDKCAGILANAPGDGFYALVDFDVNYFSQYNANNGLDAGDALLKRVAAKAQSCCKPGELCARQEADHFICLLHGSSEEEILSRIRKADHGVRSAVSAQMLLISYGVVMVTDPSLAPAALRNQAVVAKRTVKGNYEDNIAVYDSALHTSQLQEMALLAGLETALEQDEYVIFLQPKVDAATEKPVGAEALVRHIGPDGTVMSAGPIIEALERKGFVAKLDYYILEAVCRFLKRSLDAGRKVFPVSSNFSRVHLYNPAFPENVARTVDAYGIPHDLIEIELTETAFLAGKDVMQTTVHRLHERGFRVSIDDFGSGYSSLNILKDVEVDVLKLDREFLADFMENTRSRMIIQHTIRLAQELHITSVAEGGGDGGAAGVSPVSGLRPGPGVSVRPAADRSRLHGKIHARHGSSISVFPGKSRRPARGAERTPHGRTHPEHFSGSL